ncbi:hypothetical protein [Aureispira anguillae]|uniref:Uncharacterized protein n=1 Tax=Aureispira anguillae TaxID=2864201 RepID=A0A916DT67_9BACT|nr:hypothetical protein [Aureispira anguillae]BDS11547.1 hypothetical protein AsAng_0022610 [Aureispira anguillae]
MSYFSLKKRTIPQLFLLVLGALGTFNTLAAILNYGLRESSQIVALVLFLGCIWSGTSPTKEEEKLDQEEQFDDILDR